MPSAAPLRDARRLGERVSAVLICAVVVVAALAARLPFLLRGLRFFDSDEAVEGLMARHVLRGEWPLFLWGQRYKGVPEVYLTAVWFHLRGESGQAVALKAVTLACFAVYAYLNFRLVAQLFSRRAAWIATALLIAGPPSLVFWSLSGSAEIAMTFIAGTALLLGLGAWHRTGARAGLAVAGAALGFGLWIQQYIVYYAAAVAVTTIGWSPQGFARLREFTSAAETPRWLRVVFRLIAIAGCLYLALGLVAFLGLGFSATVSGIPIAVTHPQKMWWIAAGLLTIAAAGTIGAHIVHFRTSSAWLPPALGFLVGFAPAIAGRLLTSGFGAPIARMDFAGLQAALPSLATVAVPIVFGFKSPLTERLSVPAWLAAVVAATVILSYARVLRMPRDERRPLRPVFHVFAIVAPILFVASGAFIDAQSYRYLMPLHAALPVVYAVGIDAVWRTNRIAGATLLSILVAVFVLQQVDWYRRLEPDRETDTIINCLASSGVRAAYADYWLSYKLTFLTDERVIVAPTDGVDRYPPYTAAVRAQAGAPTIERRPAGSSCEEIVRTHR